MVHPWLSSHSKIHWHMFCFGLFVWTVICFSPDTREMYFSLEKAILWMEDPIFCQFEVKSTLMMDLFLTNTAFHFTRVNWWTGFMQITCGLLWFFYQLFELSIERSIGEQVMLNFSKSSKGIYILDGLRVSKFSANVHFWVSYSFKVP